jgi:hypothetical protein
VPHIFARDNSPPYITHYAVLVALPPVDGVEVPPAAGHVSAHAHPVALGRAAGEPAWGRRGGYAPCLIIKAGHHRWGAPVAVAPRALRPPLARAPDGSERAIANAELAEGCGQMHLDRAFSDVQLARYHLVAEARDHEREDFGLPSGENVFGFHRRSPVGCKTKKEETTLQASQQPQVVPALSSRSDCPLFPLFEAIPE